MASDPHEKIAEPLNLFVSQASLYAQFRPTYPPALFDQLYQLCPEHQLAIDFATGNGQAARELANRFTQVIGVDLSAEQIAHAAKKENLSYIVSSVESFAEANNRPADKSVDLITVAEAVHWFDLEKFYPLVRRLLKPKGVLAVWGYNMPKFNHNPIDKLVDSYCYELLGGYLHPRVNSLLQDEYDSLPFPFKQLQEDHIQTRFVSKLTISRTNLLGFINSWSCTQLAFEQLGTHPIPNAEEDIKSNWGSESEDRPAEYHIFLRVGLLE